MNLFVVQYVILKTTSTSTHFEKHSIAIKINFPCTEASGKGPRMSIPHYVNGQNMRIGFCLTRDPEGAC